MAKLRKPTDKQLLEDWRQYYESFISDVEVDTGENEADKLKRSELEHNLALIRETLDMLRRIAEENPRLPVTAGMADFYHELAESGKLPIGRIGDFCAAAPRVMMLDYGNKPSAAATAVENELAAMPRGSSALVGINLAGHTSVDAGALRRRDWNDLMRGMKYLLGRFGRHPGFDGFVLAPLSALEFIRMERD